MANESQFKQFYIFLRYGAFCINFSLGAFNYTILELTHHEIMLAFYEMDKDIS
jgi:hypothetical protein